MEDIPSNQNNIYPKSVENLKALLNYYFNNHTGSINDLILNDFSLNQLEYIAEKTSKHISFLEENVGITGKTGVNYLCYGIDALTKPEILWNGSSNRKNITKKLKEMIEFDI